MSKKRYGPPRPKQGQSKVQWGSTADDGEDFFMCYGGQQSGKAVSRLLMHTINERTWNRFTEKYEPSLVEKLEAAGYNTKTLKISVDIQSVEGKQ